MHFFQEFHTHVPFKNFIYHISRSLVHLETINHKNSSPEHEHKISWLHILIVKINNERHYPSMQLTNSHNVNLNHKILNQQL